MRWRRAATVVRGIGWTAAGLVFFAAAGATFAMESTDTLTIALFGVMSLVILGAAHLIGWWIDKRGDRLVTR
jgi:heme O synthase-like polyprenyltransferase